MSTATLAETPAPSAAVYCRISSDPSGQALGVTRQREDCIRLAESKGWAVTAVFTDNDISAFSGKNRPRYQAMLDLVRARGCSAIVAWAPDRLHRSPRELEDFIDLLDKYSVAVETVQSGHWDLSTPGGRLVARQLGSVARYESEHKRARVRRAMEQRAAQGKPHGRCPYGWDRQGSRDIAVPEHQRVVAEISRRIIGGDTLRAIARDLTARREPTPRDVEIRRKAERAGKVDLHRDDCTWDAMAVRTLATRDRNAGLLVRAGKVVGACANVDPLVDVGTFEQVKAVLADPSRKTSTGTVARHLLSGIARCGTCGGRMRVALRTYGGGGHGRHATPGYRCLPGGHVSRNKDTLDGFVTAIVVGRLAREDATDLLVAERGPEAAQAAEEAALLRARLDNAADAFANGDIDRRQLTRITERLRPQIEAADARARIVDDTPLFAGVVGVADVQEAWDALPLSRKRAIVDALVSIRVLPSRTGRGVFDPDAVQITWRQT